MAAGLTILRFSSRLPEAKLAVVWLRALVLSRRQHPQCHLISQSEKFVNKASIALCHQPGLINLCLSPAGPSTVSIS